MLERRVERRADEVELEPVVDGPTLLAMQRALEQVYVSESIGRYMVDLVAATRDELARPGRREPARHARAAEALARARGARRARLRHARGREGDRRAGARAPADAAAGALGAAHPRRGHRPRGARDGADAARRGRRLAPPPRTRDPARVAAARRLRGALRRSGCSPRSCSAARSSSCSRRRSRSCSPSGSRSAARRGSSVACALDARARARGREVAATIVVARGDAGRAARGAARAPVRAATATRRRTRSTLRLARGRGAHARAADRLRALGRLRAGRGLRPRPRPARRSSTLRGGRRPARAAEGLPAARSSCSRCSPARDAGLRRQPGRAREGRRDRVRRHPPVRARATASAAINWRASARRGELVVNETHPERNTDVILFLDSFAEARGEEHGHARPDRARRRPRSPSATSRARTASASSASAASSAGSCRRPGSSSSTGSSTRCSTPRSSSTTPGRTST